MRAFWGNASVLFLCGRTGECYTCEGRQNRNSRSCIFNLPEEQVPNGKEIVRFENYPAVESGRLGEENPKATLLLILDNSRA